MCFQMSGWNPVQRHCKRLKQTTEDVTPQNRHAEQQGVVDLFITGRPGNGLFGLPILRGPAARRARLRARHRTLSLSPCPSRRDTVGGSSDPAGRQLGRGQFSRDGHAHQLWRNAGRRQRAPRYDPEYRWAPDVRLCTDERRRRKSSAAHGVSRKRSAIRASACRPHIFTMPRTGANARWQ